jgi:predicted enzyme related to lactoylglutathione lyase
MSQATQHAIHWFEIPVRDLARAEAFYGRVIDRPLRREQIGDAVMAVFPKSEDGVSGCLFQAPSFVPSMDGTMVYLNAGASLDAALGRVEAAGGRITLPRTALPEGMGFFAHFTDCEGNRVGLHALS